MVMTMDMDKVQWKHRLVAAFVGGMAGAIDSGLALLIVAPGEFNLGPRLLHTLFTVLVLGVLTGIKTQAAYLKQCPTPWDDQMEDRRLERKEAKERGTVTKQ